MTTTLLKADEWEVKMLELNPEVVGSTWAKLQEYKTLFSDLTRYDLDNFINSVTSDYIHWYGIYKDGEMLGLMWLEGIEQIIDCNIHLVFFDRSTSDKVSIARRAMVAIFDQYPLYRITAVLPDMYYATIRLVEKIGFTKEGKKRKAVLIRNQWRDLAIYGLLRKEVAEWD
jgi:hypothetical protein